ncbi:hypothetical protein D3C85_1349910 [compost metagenome]
MNLVKQTLNFMGLSGIDFLSEASRETEGGKCNGTQSKKTASIEGHQNLRIHVTSPADMESARRGSVRESRGMMPI